MERTTFNVRVDSVRDEAHGVRSFSVSRLDGQPFDHYEPGAHIDVTGPRASRGNILYAATRIIVKRICLPSSVKTRHAAAHARCMTT